MDGTNANRVLVIEPEDVDLEMVRHLRILDLVPGVDQLPGTGPEPEQLPSGVRWRVIENVALSWSAIGNLAIGEMLGWHGTGVGKVRMLLDFLRAEVGDKALALPPRAGDATDNEIVNALRRVAAWGSVEGAPNLVTALTMAATAFEPTAPLEAIRTIITADLRSFAGPEMLLLADPVDAANNILDQFEGRDRLILEGRILATRREGRLTLQQLADQLNLTRERVRQLETVVETQLRTEITRDKNAAFRRRADDIHRLVGIACPLDLAPSELQPDTGSLLDELFSYAAGEYQIVDNWIVMPGLGSVSEMARLAVQSAGQHDIADYDDAVAELESLGFVRQAAERAIKDIPRLHTRDTRVFVWPTTMGDKACMLLRLAGEAQTSDEMFESVPKAENLQSFRNALGSDERIIRVGKNRYGLAEWSGEKYEGVVPAMLAEIDQTEGPVLIADLGRALADRFGISTHSVTINATIHPAFVAEKGWVRRRRSDEPYTPKTGIEMAPSCFMVDGSWAYRIQVDRDVLRGSGRVVPEQFAIHLGVPPGTSTRIPGPYGNLWAGWDQQPHIGSVRVAALEHGLVEGDYLFVTRPTPQSVDFVGVSATESDDALTRLAGMVGVEDPRDRTWQRIVGDALGFGAAVEPSTALLKARAGARGDLAMVAAIDELTAV